MQKRLVADNLRDRGKRRKLEERWSTFEREREAIQRSAELDHYRSLEEERRKWEVRESRLIEQLENLKLELSNHKPDSGYVDNPVVVKLQSELQLVTSQLDSSKVQLAEAGALNSSQQLETQELRAEIALLQVRLKRAEGQGRDATTPESRATMANTAVRCVMPAHSSSGEVPSSLESRGGTTPTATGETIPTSSVDGGGAPASSVAVSGGTTLTTSGPLTVDGKLARVPPLPSVSLFTGPTSLLAQLPQIPRFSGEDLSDGETFLDWFEQFESVATLGKWNDHCKLVNLTTRLRGAAYSFYRSYTPEQRSNYVLLVTKLKKWFTRSADSGADTAVP